MRCGPAAGKNISAWWTAFFIFWVILKIIFKMILK